MVSNNDKWIRIFDIPDVSKHKHGFTIYKVLSLLYPASCPDAVTKVTVWKRFNDFKKLNHDLKVLHGKLNLKTKFPSLPSRTIFKRFDECTISERRRSIQNFLEFVGNNQQLFTSNEFVKFLETSHTPADHLNSNINTIRAELNLPEDPQVSTHLSDDELTISDTDSITTLNSLSPSVQADIFAETINNNASVNNLKKLNSTTSINSQCSSRNSDSLSITPMVDTISLLEDHGYLTPSNIPGSGNISEQVQYIIDATLHIKLASELESDKKYEQAFCAYETAIDILLKYGKEDNNYDRRQMVRYRTEKYLIQAEKIYNMYLAPEIKDLRIRTDEVVEKPEQTNAKRPLFDLYKYKVVKIISSSMLVLHSELQQLFYIKVIHKTVQFLNDNLILPEDVPYMIKLQNHYNCENALFLVLEYCSGMALRDYLKNESMSDNACSRKDSQILKQIQDLSDNESELSFSDLINDYSINRSKKSDVDAEDGQRSSDGSYEKVEIGDLLPDDKKLVKNLMDEPLKQCDVEDLVSKSQQLLSSVDSALAEQEYKYKYTETKASDNLDKKRPEYKRSVSSSVDLDDFKSNLVLPDKTVVRWAAQLLLALEKLHKLGVTCRDLCMKNLLINDKSDLVLTYMCNAKEFGDVFVKEMDHNLAPEVYSFQQVTTAADWWNYGAILYELLVGIPLSDVHPSGITSHSHLKIPKYVTPEGRSLLRQLLTYEPHNRLGSGINGTENIKSHPFFSTVSWDLLLSPFHQSDVCNIQH